MPEVWLFFIAAMTLTLAPGPDNIYVLTRGIAQGRKAGLVALFSGTVGAFFQRKKSAATTMNRLAGCAFIGLGMRIALPQ